MVSPTSQQPDQYQFNQSDLAQLQCPNQPANGSACPRGDQCPFGHQVSGGLHNSKLHLVTSNFCVDFLLGLCKNPSYKSDIDSLRWCATGLHPSDLAELNKIVREMAEREISLSDKKMKKTDDSNSDTSSSLAISTDSSQDKSDSVSGTNSVCGLCAKSVVLECRQPFGLLECCSCSFCFNCIVKSQQALKKKQQAFECPTCKTLSERILIWPFWLSSPKMKLALLNAQESCLTNSEWPAGSVISTVPDRVFILILTAFSVALIVLYIFF